MRRHPWIVILATATLFHLSESFSPIASPFTHSNRYHHVDQIRTVSSSSALYDNPYMTIHEDGMSKEDKEELMPCEVKRYGVFNKKVIREDTYNPDGPPLHNPRRRQPAPRRPATQQQQDYPSRNTNQPPAHLFQRHERKQPVVDARVVPNEEEVMSRQLMQQQRQQTSDFQPWEYGPRGQAPPMGMFLNEKTGGNRAEPVPVSMPAAPSRPPPPPPPPPAAIASFVSDNALKAPPSDTTSSTGTSSRRAPGPPPMGMFLKDHQGSIENFEPESQSSGGSGRRAPGPPPVGMFLKEKNLDLEETVSKELPFSLPPSSPPPPPSTPTSSPPTSTISTSTAAAGASSSFGGFQRSFSSKGGVSLQNIQFKEKYMKDVRSRLLVLNGAAFAYQILTTAYILLSQRSASIWPHSLTGTAPASAQPIMRDWMFTSRLAKWQPHRYLTAGFAHSGILHFLLSTDAIRFLPERLEQSVGGDVYGTTFALSLIAGHFGHSVWGGAVSATGAGAGIAGIYGLALIHELLRGQQGSEDRQNTLRATGLGLGRQILYSLCLPRMFSTAATCSGFLAGIAAGTVFTLASPPSSAGNGQRNMAVFAVWFASLSALFLVPTLRSAPFLFLQSLFQPGSLSMGRSRF